VRRLVKDVLIPLAVAVALAFVIQAAVAKPYEIPTESMVPTIRAGDRIVANRLIYRFREVERGDIVVFDPPPSAALTCGDPEGDVPFVKRVVGVAGDVVAVRSDGVTLVNGEPFDVPRALRPDYSMAFPRVPAGRLLVLGDNRPGSCDSHQWRNADGRNDPFVSAASVIGQAEVTYWPAGRLGFLD